MKRAGMLVTIYLICAALVGVGAITYGFIRMTGWIKDYGERLAAKLNEE